MTIKDLVEKYVIETVNDMNHGDLERFATDRMVEAMEDLSDQEVIFEIRDGCYSHLADEYDEANEDKVNNPNMNGGIYG